MKKIWLLLLLCLPLACPAQTAKSTSCAPMRNGKVCYTWEVEINAGKTALFNALNKWATDTYGREVFLSSVSSNTSRQTVLVSSKVELLLNDTEKTIVKYKLNIACYDNRYAVEIKDIVYQYDPDHDKRYKTWPAESVIANEGKGNTVSSIKDPVLFCNATLYFAENLLADIREAAKKAR